MLAPSTTSYAIPAKVSYPTDIDDTAWALIGPVLRRQTTRGRPRVHGDREVYDAITYVLRGGIAWRLLPKSFPPWQTIYGRFRTWADNGVWEKLTDVVRTILRAELGRELSPSAGVIDSQSVTSGPGCGAVGNDPGKKVHGRKRHIVVDTEGLLLGVVVTPANVQDPTAAPGLLDEAVAHAPGLRRIWGDARYQGKFIDWAKTTHDITVEIVRKPPEQRGFQVLPRRWVVERTFAWLGRYRRIARDWEAASWSASALVHIAASNMMARRIARLTAA